MSNPDLLLCDTDSLIQLFLTAAQTQNLLPLRVLRDDYGVQPMITAEVEAELMWNGRYNDRFAQVLKKALSNGLIKVLSEASLSQHMASHLAKSVFASCQALGKEYASIADPGEAYTLAAAVTLNVPAMSNDRSALEPLEYNGKQVPATVLRAFDIICFAYQIGALDEKECDRVRKFLVQGKEWVPWAFQNKSFLDGVASFCFRMQDGNATRIGAAPSSKGPAYAGQIFLTKVVKKAS